LDLRGDGAISGKGIVLAEGRKWKSIDRSQTEIAKHHTRLLIATSLGVAMACNMGVFILDAG
jgi:hypothetical protein